MFALQIQGLEFLLKRLQSNLREHLLRKGSPPPRRESLSAHGPPKQDGGHRKHGDYRHQHIDVFRRERRSDEPEQQRRQDIGRAASERIDGEQIIVGLRIRHRFHKQCLQDGDGPFGDDAEQDGGDDDHGQALRRHKHRQQGGHKQFGCDENLAGTENAHQPPASHFPREAAHGEGQGETADDLGIHPLGK